MNSSKNMSTWVHLAASLVVTPSYSGKSWQSVNSLWRYIPNSSLREHGDSLWRRQTSLMTHLADEHSVQLFKEQHFDSVWLHWPKLKCETGTRYWPPDRSSGPGDTLLFQKWWDGAPLWQSERPTESRRCVKKTLWAAERVSISRKKPVSCWANKTHNFICAPDGLLTSYVLEASLTSLFVRPPFPHLCSLRVCNKQEVSASEQVFIRGLHHCSW